jgi:hypothetical protein
MAHPEWHWADPIVLNFNRHPPSSELPFVNWVGPDSLCKWNEVWESGRTRLIAMLTTHKFTYLWKDKIPPLLYCLEDVNAWMALHFLSFNDSKTEVLLLGPGTTCNTNGIDLSTLSTYVKSHRRRLGRTALRNSFDKQVKSVVKSSFFQLRNISKVKKRDCAWLRKSNRCICNYQAGLL